MTAGSRRRAAAVATAAATVAAAVVVRRTVGYVTVHLGPSMRPTLPSGSVHVVAPLRRPRAERVARGDLVLARIGWRSRIVRVVGLPREHVVVDARGAVTVNDVPLHEPYVKLDERALSALAGAQSASDQVFVLGDDRGSAVDSRHVSPIPEQRLKGRVVRQVWPRRPANEPPSRTGR